MTDNNQQPNSGQVETPENYLKMRPWIFGLTVFLVANMLYICW